MFPFDIGAVIRGGMKGRVLEASLDRLLSCIILHRLIYLLLYHV